MVRRKVYRHEGSLTRRIFRGFGLGVPRAPFSSGNEPVPASARKGERYPDHILGCVAKTRAGQSEGTRKLEGVWTVEMRRRTKVRPSSIAIP
jgi:hypothetical protein